MADAVNSKPSLAEDGFIPLEYGDLELPQFGEQEEKIRGMELRFEDLVSYVEAKESSDAEGTLKLNDLSGSRALTRIDALVAEYITLQAQKLGLSPEYSEHLNNVSTLKKWKGVGSDSPEKFVLRELVARADRLRNQLVDKWMEGATDTGFSDVAKLEYEHLMPAMAAIDRMYIRMTTEQFPIDSNEREKRGLKNEFAVVREIAGEVKEVPFHEAYSEETIATVDCYDDLISALKGLAGPLESSERNDSLVFRKIKYYETLRDAYSTDDPEIWKKADALLPRQIVGGGDVLHIHTSEYGYMKDGIIRAPELSLRAPDLEREKALANSVETKATMIASFESEYFDDCPEIKDTIALLKNSNATVRHFLGSGMAMDLKAAGQILPNEFEARVAGGINSSLDRGTVKIRRAEGIGDFKQVFGEDAYNNIAASVINTADESVDSAIGHDIASHELGHAMALLNDTKERLGGATLVNAYVEEWKATVGGVVGNLYVPYLQNPNEESFGKLKNWVVGHIGTACRYATTRNQDHSHPYFRKTMMLMKVLEDVGVLDLKEGDAENPWHIDVADEKVKVFFEKLFNQYKQMTGMYGHGTEEDLNNYLGENLQDTDFMNFLCSKHEVPDMEKNSPARLAMRPMDLEKEKKDKEAAALAVGVSAGKTGKAVDEVLKD
ncbi:MAG: hypothetical protein WC269_00075 [Candidatus Gracilibacteria bacterium]|jgi:hypothetical protein